MLLMAVLKRCHLPEHTGYELHKHIFLGQTNKQTKHNNVQGKLSIGTYSI